ncbi:MAG: hypothetical protein P8Q36_19855 [Alphaproteobacteria bacterium]|nr:hypothetical protein [Rhodospirillaceae bacterium]MBT7645449.1 hypothetical protein [Rhodospirillaceae bacterium]MDG2483097.1 hypothetical protein [Alphaproteobacteria bacterium]
MTTGMITRIATVAVLSLGLQACYVATNNNGYGQTAINFGDDSSQWAYDRECDDPRFAGPAMATAGLSHNNSYRDATDCRNAFSAGQVWLASGQNTNTYASNSGSYGASINFGDDASAWSYDGECDDPRFYGGGMTSTPLLAEDRYHDATDCRQQYNAGRIALR